MTLRYRKAELRAFTIALTVDPNTTGAVVHVTGIAQGDDVNERQGNMITLRKLNVRGSVLKNSASSVPTKLRIMVVRDNLGTTTPPTIGSMFSTVAVFAANQNADGDPQTVARFTVLMDRFISLVDDATSEQQGFSMTKTLNSTCLFTGTAASNEGKGCLYLFIASSETTNDPVVAADAQIFYTDG